MSVMTIRPRWRGVGLILVLATILAVAVTIRINYAQKHWLPRGDEGPWVRMASRFPGSGFLSSTSIEHDLYPARRIPHPEDNRSPLFPALIGIVGLTGVDTFVAGKMLGLCVFVASFLALFAVIRRQIGTAAALSAVMFFAASPFFVVYSVKIYPDMLVAVSFFLYLSYSRAIPMSRRNAFLGGVVLGALVLLKSTAVFLVPVQIHAFYLNRRREELHRNLAIFLLSALVVTLPWFARNMILFGTPLYQFSGYLLWVDNVRDLFVVGASRPTISGYIGEHGPAYVFFVRPLMGLWKFIKVFPQFDHGFCLALMPFSVVGLWWLCRQRLRGVKPHLFFVAMYLPLMSYIAYAGWVDRYSMIMYLWIYVAAAAGIGTIAGLIKPLMIRMAAHALMSVIPLAAVVWPLEYYNSNRASELTTDLERRSVISAVTELVPQHATIYSSFLGGYYQLHSFGVVNSRIRVQRPEDFARLKRDYRIEYALLYLASDKAILKMLNENSFIQAREVWREGDYVLYAIQTPGS